MEAGAAVDAAALRALRRPPAEAPPEAARGARGASGDPLRAEPVEDLAAARSDWTALAEQSGNIFATWEWVDPWPRHFGRGVRPAVALARDDGDRPLAVLPLGVRGLRP